MKRDRLQCKDIPTEPILRFVGEHGGIGCNWFDTDYGNPRSVRHAMPSGLPDSLVLAKMRQLISKRLVSGCDCGCRGDYELTDRGREFLAFAEPQRKLMSRAARIDAIARATVVVHRELGPPRTLAQAQAAAPKPN